MTKKLNRILRSNYMPWLLIIFGFLNFAFYPNWTFNSRANWSYEDRLIIGLICIALGVAILIYQKNKRK